MRVVVRPVFICIAEMNDRRGRVECHPEYNIVYFRMAAGPARVCNVNSFDSQSVRFKCNCIAVSIKRKAVNSMQY